jgi:hypothetical protein
MNGVENQSEGCSWAVLAVLKKKNGEISVG